jgi:hypothetical protein
MAVSGNLQLSVGYIQAAADYSANQFYAVKMDSNGDFELCDTLGEFIDGIIAHPAGAGEALGVTIGGVEKGAAGAAVAAGDDLAIDATGRFITAASGHAIVGRAQSAAGAAGELISVLIGYKGLVP